MSTKTKRVVVQRKPAVAAATGPVTLAEARALVKRRQATSPKTDATKAAPKRSAVRKRAMALPPPSPATVGAERKRLERERRLERVRRLRDYKATMAIMKQRGARAAVPARKATKAKGAKAAAKTVAKTGGGFAPLQILAEGDSWFDYPALFFGGGIVPRLEERLGVPILNLAKAGDEVRYMLGVKERKLLAQQLADGCPAGGPWDVLLFSGGGNDIVDNPMALWVRDWDPNAAPAGLLHQARFDAALALVRAGYEDLIALRNQLSPATQLVFHGYDFAIPDGRGICFMGPWLKPTFDLRGFPTQADGFAVVKLMLQQFAAMLASLGTQPGVSVIQSQATLAPQTSSWHNELHPAKAGFETFAGMFQAALMALFPLRVA